MASAEVGGGAASLGWTLAVGITWYAGRHCGLTMAYRVLGVDDSDAGFVQDVEQQGVLLGLDLPY